MRIIFVRHGESMHNAGMSDGKDTALTAKGRKQAELLGRRLKNHNISVIYTSSLLRAKQTGGVISKIIKVPVKRNIEELDEYPTRYIKSKFKILLNKKRLKRLKELLKRISEEREKNKTILIIAHGITNRIIMAHFLEIPLKKQLILFRQYNSCINSIEWNKEYHDWNMDSMNDIEHLPKSLRSIK
jgi:probable phosphoglycerate mutase